MTSIVVPAAPFVSSNLSRNGRGTAAKILGNFGVSRINGMNTPTLNGIICAIV